MSSGGTLIIAHPRILAVNGPRSVPRGGVRREVLTPSLSEAPRGNYAQNPGILERTYTPTTGHFLIHREAHLRPRSANK
jgi:hypothetical protein